MYQSSTFSNSGTVWTTHLDRKSITGKRTDGTQVTYSWPQGGKTKLPPLDMETGQDHPNKLEKMMTSKKVFAKSDAKDLLAASDVTARAILANCVTTIVLNSAKPGDGIE